MSLRERRLHSDLVQFLNLPFFPSNIRAEPGRATRKVQNNLHAHAQNEPIIPFSARALKNKNSFFGVDIVVKNKLIRVLLWSVLL